MRQVAHGTGLGQKCSQRSQERSTYARTGRPWFLGEVSHRTKQTTTFKARPRMLARRWPGLDGVVTSYAVLYCCAKDCRPLALIGREFLQNRARAAHLSTCPRGGSH